MNSTTFLSGIAIIAFILYKYSRRFPFHNIPGPKSNSFWLGHLCELFQFPTAVTELQWQETYGGVVRFKVSFGSEQLMITDPKALQHIFQTTDYRWRKSRTRREISRLTSGRGLAWSDGDAHKRQRKIMLPGFSAPEAKNLLPFFLSCASMLCSRWGDIISTSSERSQVFNIPEWTARAALDAIGQAAFDYDFGATGGQGNELGRLYQNLMAKSFSIPSKAGLLMLEVFEYIPTRVMEWMDNHNPRFAPLHRVAQVATTTSRNLVAMKSNALLESRNKKDVMSVLVKANLDVSQNPSARLTEEELLSSMRLLIFAGHETSANTLSWMFYELTCNMNLQSRLREEIRSTERKVMGRGDAEISMQDLESMPLLNAVVKETLRFHPVSPYMFRTSIEDDVLPLSKPITTTTGEVLHELPIPKGTKVFTSISAYNRNTDVFGDDASVFNPDRWLEPGHVKTGVSFGVYANIATFSAGIRSCIGWRFAVLELQAFLYEMLRNFEFTATPQVHNVRRVTAFVMIPSIEGELEKGSQMPLKVAFAPREED
ncbi:hypothetical protein GYMLUDRAFT_200098, partial [Collybiopsis luxurians FD-317 M1]